MGAAAAPFAMTANQTKTRQDHESNLSYFRCHSNVHHQLAVMKAIEDNDLTPERLRQISATDQALFDATVEIERQFQAKKVEVKK